MSDYCSNISLTAVDNGFKLTYTVKGIAEGSYGEPYVSRKEEVYKFEEASKAMLRMLELIGFAPEEEYEEEDDEMNSDEHYDEIVPPESPRTY